MRVGPVSRRQPIQSSSEVLRRKLRTDRSSPVEQAVSPVKALRLALARAVDHVIKLPLRVQSVRQSRLDVSDTLTQIDGGWALFLLEHADGNFGAFCVDPNSVIAFVQQQTSGQVSAQEGDARPLTRTDKSLTTPIIEAFLRRFDAALDGAPTAFWTCGYKCAEIAPSKHDLALKLDAAEYRGFDIQIEISDGLLQSSCRLFLPIKEPIAPTSGRAKNKAKESEKRAVRSARGAALGAQVELRADLCTLQMTLADLRQFKTGHSLALPKSSLQSAVLSDRRGVTRFPIHLGQLNGLRAARFASAQDGAKAPQKNPALPPSLPKVAPDTTEQDVQANPRAQDVEQDGGEMDELDKLMLETDQ